MALNDMQTEEILHWIGELTTELARRAQPAQPAQPPWMAHPDVRAGAATPPAYQPPRQEPKARPFTSSTAPNITLAPVPAGGLPPGTPLTQPVPATDPTVAALIAQLQAQIAGQQVTTPAPARGVITTTAKTDPETARVFLSVPPRPEGSPPINGGAVGGGAVLEQG